MASKYKLGIDIGGTFTDLVFLEEATGNIFTYKVPSVPRSPSKAVVRGIREAMELLAIGSGDITYFVHGTTIAVNTIIERTGASVGLLVTEGNKDILTIARLRLPNTMSLVTQVPEPLVPRSHVREIRGRILSSGQVLRDLSTEGVRRAIQELSQEGVHSWAICLLNSYVNPTQERTVARLLREEFPEAYVSVSSDLWPEIREYERAMVAVMNAYIFPRMLEYLDSLHGDMSGLGLTIPLFITKSNGGMMRAFGARQAPVETLLSGPASGVVGAAFIARLTGQSLCLAVDMGGTSVDVSFIINGEPLFSTENHVADLPVILPSVDVSSIGAGGGSIAWVDAFGLLKVGPQSAGADPGPACYAQGGQDPTITDAYLKCGYLNPENFLGGRMPLDAKLAEEALSPIAERLSLSTLDAAESILRVATANMAAELLPLMTLKGVDPRDCSLVAYGGAGPTHACLLAEEVGIGRVIVPLSPGMLSALGCLLNDVKKDYVKTIKKDLAATSTQDLGDCYQEMEEAALRWLRDEGPIVRECLIVESADMRYKGQAYEINVELPPDWRQSLAGMGEMFHSKHEQIYRQCDREAAVEVVNARLRIIGKVPELVPKRVPRATGPAQDVCRGIRSIYCQGQFHAAAIYQRGDLQWGHTVPGPAIVEQDDTTTLILPGFQGSVDAYGNIIAERTTHP